jgi:hypothetical protein
MVAANQVKGAARRLFSRTEIPMRVVLEGHALAVLNWSLGGLALARPCPLPLQPGQELPATLELLVGGVSLSVRVTLRYVHEQADRLGFAFVALTPEQMGMLRALLMRGGASPLERAPLPAQRNAAAIGPQRPRRPRRRRAGKRVLVRWLARIAAVAVILAAASAMGAYGLVKKSQVTSAQAAVAVATRVAAAGERGYVEEILVAPGAMVAAGEPLISMRLRAEPARPVTLASPCACTVVAVLARAGEDVHAGQPLVQLSTDAGPPFVEALVRPHAGLNIGDSVRVQVEGSPATRLGRVAALDGERPTVGRYGLPMALRQDQRYQLVVVDQLSGGEALVPGAAARLRLDPDASWSARIAGEAARLREQAFRVIEPWLQRQPETAG